MVLEGLIYWVNSEFIIYYLLEFIKDIVWEFLGRFIINIYDGKKKIYLGDIKSCLFE